jgi:hypothetical protein
MFFLAELKPERTLQLDRDSETSRRLRLRAKNLATSAQKRAGSGRRGNSDRYLYRGTLRDQKGARQQKAADTDVL